MFFEAQRYMIIDDNEDWTDFELIFLIKILPRLG